MAHSIFPKITATNMTLRIPMVIANIRRLNATGFNFYSPLFTLQLIPYNSRALPHLQ